MDKKGLAIIFHSGSFDRLYHGLSIALAGLALDREVRLFFTYWALDYLRKDRRDKVELQIEDAVHKKVIEDNLQKGHIQELSGLIARAKLMGARCYVCTSSMGLLNISRDELVGEVDKSMGITTFLTEVIDYQLLFI